MLKLKEETKWHSNTFREAEMTQIWRTGDRIGLEEKKEKLF